MSKIITGLYLGDYENASSPTWLKQKHITHIVNCTTEHQNYYPKDYVYLNLNLDDSENQVIYPVLEKSYNFIKKANENGGNIIVHCHAGISRSASIVIYYLMKTNKSSFESVYAFVKSKRIQISPNNGFIRQLVSVTPQVNKQLGNSTYQKIPDYIQIPTRYDQPQFIEGRAQLMKKYTS